MTAQPLDLVRRAALAQLLPPPKLALSQWIEQHLFLPDGVSAQPGPVRLWEPQRGVADAIEDLKLERVSIVKAARIGFTTLLTGAIASYAANEPAPVLALLPTEADARRFVVDNVEPIFGASALAGRGEAFGLNAIPPRRCLPSPSALTCRTTASRPASSAGPVRTMPPCSGIPGRPVRRFERIPGTRTEALDCLVYAFAARRGVTITFDNREDELRGVPAAPPAPRIARSKFVNRNR